MSDWSSDVCSSDLDVGIDREGFLIEGDVHHDVGGPAADAGEFFERVAIGGNLAVMVGDQRLRQRHHVLPLGVDQPARLDVLFAPRLAERDHLRGRIEARKSVDAGTSGSVWVVRGGRRSITNNSSY